MRNFVASREDYKIDAIMQEVGLPERSNRRWQKKLINELSGGQQRKIAIAKLLLQEHTILILDEPTNHLDLATKERLLERIEQFGGMIIVISHDRPLLQSSCDGILEIEPDAALYFDGNYESYKEQKALLLNSQHEQYIVYIKRKKKMEEWLAHIRQRASVYVSPALGKLLKNKEKYYDREIVKKAVDKPQEQRDMQVSFSGGVYNGKLLFACKNRQC